jgi:N-acetylmuramoyl-L-alanine amidase
VQQFAHSEAEREDRGVKQAGFLVLRETAMPSVLVETGYLTNRVEEEYLASDEGREQMAIAIFKAFEAYKNQMEGRGPSTKPTIIPAKKAEPKTPPPAKSQPVAQKANVNQQPVAKNGTKPAAPKPEIFRILLLSWPNRLDRNAGQLGLLGDVKEENKEGKYHYFTGQYASRADAEKMLPEIKNLGFKTATIVQN